MDRTTFRIMDTLSRDLASPASINELTKRISKLHRKAYYKNVYDKVQELSGKGSLRITSAGKSSLVSINFDSPAVTTLLGEMEIMKKSALVSSEDRISGLMSAIDAHFRKGSDIISISMSTPLKNISLNRAELLIIIHDPSRSREESGHSKADPDKREEAHSGLCSLGNHLNIRIDSLALERGEFISLLRKGDPFLKSFLSDHSAFFRPEDLWIAIGEACREGIRFNETPDPPGISERDLSHNLERLGYIEFGKQGSGRDIPLEYVITSVLLSGDARRIEAVPVLLSKNKANYSLLTFLCKKHNVAGILLGLLRALNKIRPSRETLLPIRTMKAAGIKEKKADLKVIKKKMELYHAA
jgi:hypothetical protein